MGFEKNTFVFYFVGAAGLLASILILPAVCGVYAYVIGLGISFTLNAVCNLFLLNKKCPLYTKGDRRVLVQSILPALICILPLSLFGQLCNALLKNFAGERISVLLTILLLTIATLFVYAITGLLSLKGVFNKIFGNREAQKRPSV
jgi:hypothetical protein